MTEVIVPQIKKPIIICIDFVVALRITLTCTYFLIIDMPGNYGTTLNEC